MKYRLKQVSASSLQTFLQCKLKYAYNYFTKEQPIQDMSAMHWGTSIHEGLEFLGKSIKKGKPLTTNLCEKACEVYRKKFIELGLSNSSLLNEGYDLIKARIHKHNTDYKIIGVEYKFKGVKTEGGVPLGGFIDLIMEVDDDSAIVLDYKTSRYAKTQNEADEDLQLSLYNYVFRTQFPEYDNVFLVLDFLKLNPVISQRSIKDTLEFGRYLDDIWKQMTLLDDKDIKPTINKFCNWCGFRHLCDAYSGILKKKFAVKPVEAINDEEMIQEWVDLSQQQKAISSRKAQLKDWAASKLVDLDEENLESEDHYIISSQRETIEYDISKVIPHVDPKVLPKFTKIVRKSFEDYVQEEAPELSFIMNEAATSKFSTPSIRVKGKNKNEK